MKLNVLDTDASGIIRLGAEGDITIADFADPGKNPIELVLGADWAKGRILINLAAIGFMDSSALGWMFDCDRHCKKRGGRIAWYGATSRVKDMIDLLKMRQLLAIFDSDTDAKTALSA